MAYKLIIGPSVEPITLAEAKTQCRVDTSDDDMIITSFITAAREFAEHFTGRAFINQTWELALDGFPENEIELQHVPLVSITSIKYQDVNNAQQTVTSTDYTIDNYGISHFVLLAYGKSWPSTLGTANNVLIRYVAGYGAAANNVPEAIRAWMLLAVQHLYGCQCNGQAGNLDGQFFNHLLNKYIVWSL